MEKIFRKLSVVFLLLLLLINNGVVNNIQAETGGEEITLNEDENSTSVYVSNDDNKEPETEDEKIESTTIELAADESLETTTFVQDENGNLQQEEPQEVIEEVKEETSEEKAIAFDQSKQIDDVLISVTANEGVFPEGATLYAEKVEIKEVEDAISENRDENKNVAVSYTYDIKVLDSEGNELTPNGEVSVKFSLVEKIQEAVSVDVYHIDDELNVETLETTVSENTEIEEVNTDVEVTTDSFSYYTVEFTYNNLTISIDGDSTNKLLPILNNIGINGEIQNVEVSNSNLFEAYKDNDVWYVDAKQAFTSEEWMKVTVDGVEYEVEVTDAVNSTFYIEAVEDTDIALVKVGSPTIGTVKYGINNTSPSTAYTVTTSSSTIHLTAGQKCYWTITSTTTAFSSSNYLEFTSTGKINAGGNLSSLIGGQTAIPRNYCFYRLFYSCSKLIDASALNFDSIKSFNSKTYAFGYMFQNCVFLTTAPELPATTLAANCYQNMFYGCTSLTRAPELPAETLATSCYNGMFRSCRSLTIAPELPATTLAANCYQNMFQACRSLTIAPELPATTLAANCYQNMFYNCSSLTTVPELPATTLTSNCYNSMFNGCTNLKISSTETGQYRIPYRIPSAGTGTAGTGSLTDMFAETGGTFTDAPAINTTYYLWDPTYVEFDNSFFYIEAVENTTITLSKVGSPTVGAAKYSIDLGTPVDYNYGDSIALTPGQKCYWYIEKTTTAFSSSKYLKFTSTGKINAGGNLSSLIGNETTIPRNYCFMRLFYQCTKLIDASAINVGSITDFNSKEYVFANMFEGCTSLTTAPALPATTLYDFCYSSMFYGCASLTTVPTLPATTLAWGCYYQMFYNCTNIKLSETQTSEYSIPYRIPTSDTGTTESMSLNSMFAGTGGTFTGTPTINTTYYLYAPLTIDENSFYIEAVENTAITLSKVGSPTVGTAYYSINLGDPVNYNYGDSINLTAGQKCYWYLDNANATLAGQNYLKFTSTGNINAGGNLSSLIGNETSVPSNYCFFSLFRQCTKLISASAINFGSITSFNSKTHIFYNMFYGCTNLITIPTLPMENLTNYCYRDMFNGCTSLKISDTETSQYRIPFRIPTEGSGTTGSNSLYQMFTGTGGTFTGTPNINQTYYLWDSTYVELFNSSYFYIEAVENTTITLSKVGSPTVGAAKYSIDLGTPVDYNYGDNINLTAGQKCYWYIESTNTDFTNENFIAFTSTGKINAGGNLSSLIGNETIIPREWCFAGLFAECNKLIDASSINVGSITDFNSKEYVFAHMFDECELLTKAPDLPATTLTANCYNNMFYSCTSLTMAPELPATTLADNCYQEMFVGCTSLTTAPELPATTLADSCYYIMFYGCASLTTAPALPATTLANGCYAGMFYLCTSLTTPPELPATTLADNCYYGMFIGCTSLKISDTKTDQYRRPYIIPSEGTGTIGSNSLSDMFANTGGTFTGTPEINKTYYLWDPDYVAYTLSIPATVDASAGSIVISYEAIGTDVDVSITSANNWKLKNNTSSLDYSLSETAFTLIEGTGIENVNISVSGTPTLAGKHSDTVTFTYSRA